MLPPKDLLDELPDLGCRLVVDRRRHRLEDNISVSGWDLTRLEKLESAIEKTDVFAAVIRPRAGANERGNAHNPLLPSYRRVLDRFYLPALPDIAISAALFDTIASVYESIVSSDFNLTVSNELLSVVISGNSKADHRILDFGCGTGVAFRALGQFDVKAGRIEIVGTDISPAMLAIARQNGESILAIEEWRKLPAYRWTGAISAFVLHYGIPATDLQILYNQLTIGARFAANYFKGTAEDIADVTERIEAVGFRLTNVSPARATIGSPNPLLIFTKEEKT